MLGIHLLEGVVKMSYEATSGLPFKQTKNKLHLIVDVDSIIASLVASRILSDRILPQCTREGACDAAADGDNPAPTAPLLRYLKKETAGSNWYKAFSQASVAYQCFLERLGECASNMGWHVSLVVGRLPLNSAWQRVAEHSMSTHARSRQLLLAQHCAAAVGEQRDYHLAPAQALGYDRFTRNAILITEEFCIDNTRFSLVFCSEGSIRGLVRCAEEAKSERAMKNYTPVMCSGDPAVLAVVARSSVDCVVNLLELMMSREPSAGVDGMSQSSFLLTVFGELTSTICAKCQLGEDTPKSNISLPHVCALLASVDLWLMQPTRGPAVTESQATTAHPYGSDSSLVCLVRAPHPDSFQRLLKHACSLVAEFEVLADSALAQCVPEPLAARWAEFVKAEIPPVWLTTGRQEKQDEVHSEGERVWWHNTICTALRTSLAPSPTAVYRRCIVRGQRRHTFPYASLLSASLAEWLFRDDTSDVHAVPAVAERASDPKADLDKNRRIRLELVEAARHRAVALVPFMAPFAQAQEILTRGLLQPLMLLPRTAACAPPPTQASPTRGSPFASAVLDPCQQRRADYWHDVSASCLKNGTHGDAARSVPSNVGTEADACLTWPDQLWDVGLCGSFPLPADGTTDAPSVPTRIGATAEPSQPLLSATQCKALHQFGPCGMQTCLLANAILFRAGLRTAAMAVLTVWDLIATWAATDQPPDPSPSKDAGDFSRIRQWVMAKELAAAVPPECLPYLFPLTAPTTVEESDAHRALVGLAVLQYCQEPFDRCEEMLAGFGAVLQTCAELTMKQSSIICGFSAFTEDCSRLSAPSNLHALKTVMSFFSAYRKWNYRFSVDCLVTRFPDNETDPSLAKALRLPPSKEGNEAIHARLWVPHHSTCSTTTPDDEEDRTTPSATPQPEVPGLSAQEVAALRSWTPSTALADEALHPPQKASRPGLSDPAARAVIRRVMLCMEENTAFTHLLDKWVQGLILLFGNA